MASVLVVLLLLVFSAFPYIAPVVVISSSIVVATVVDTLLGHGRAHGTPFFDDAVKMCSVDGRSAVSRSIVIPAIAGVVKALVVLLRGGPGWSFEALAI